MVGGDDWEWAKKDHFWGGGGLENPQAPKNGQFVVDLFLTILTLLELRWRLLLVKEP